jgi:hypothetical protein
MSSTHPSFHYHIVFGTKNHVLTLRQACGLRKSKSLQSAGRPPQSLPGLRRVRRRRMLMEPGRPPHAKQPDQTIYEMSWPSCWPLRCSHGPVGRLSSMKPLPSLDRPQEGGYKFFEIAARKTIESHRENIKHKLQLCSCAELREGAAKWVATPDATPTLRTAKRLQGCYFVAC